MNLSFTDPLFLTLAIPTIALFVWVAILQIRISSFKKRLSELFSGTKGKDLEKVIMLNKTNISNIDEEIKDIYKITSKIQDLSLKGLHKSGLIRFNPFRDIGGDQSFSLALLDGNDDGIVISSIYSREGVRVYAKSIHSGTSEVHQLTEEEKRAIKLASIDKGTQKKKI